METIGIVLSVADAHVEALNAASREHDNHPGFAAWNKQADKYQVVDPLASGGETILTLDA